MNWFISRVLKCISWSFCIRFVAYPDDTDRLVDFIDSSSMIIFIVRHLENLNNYASLAKYYTYLYIDLFHTIFTSSNSNWPFPESWILVRGLPRIGFMILVYIIRYIFRTLTASQGPNYLNQFLIKFRLLMKNRIGNTRLRHKINRYLNTERDRKRVCGWDKLNERNYYI